MGENQKRSPKKAHWFTGGSWVLESLGVYDIGEGCNLCNPWGDSMASTLCQLIRQAQTALVHSVPYQNMCVLKICMNTMSMRTRHQESTIYIYVYIYICIYIYIIRTYIWVNCNDLTATSLESWLIREIIPRMALIQVSEICSFTQIHGHRP